MRTESSPSPRRPASPPGRPAGPDPLRAVLAPRGEVLVGALGPLTAAGGAEALRALGGLAGTRLLLLGDGPLADRLRLHLPDALHLGVPAPAAVRDLLARLDVAVLPGPGVPDELRAAAVASGAALCVVAPPGTRVPEGAARVAPGAWGDLRATVRDLAARRAAPRSTGRTLARNR